MQKNKKITFYLLIFLLFISCGEYQKILNNGTAKQQYRMAVEMYEAKKYSKALRLFEKITPLYRGKPQMERIQYMVANSNLNNKDYHLAGYYFKRFTENYPKSSKKEEASFLSAFSFYKSSPKYSLDPTETKKALKALQNFIDKYPNSTKVKEANKYYAELRFRLEKKAFEIAKTYYKTVDYDSRNYKAAIAAFDNLLSDYLGTQFKEEALFYRLKSAYDFVLKSTNRRKANRIKVAEKAYDKLKKNFPNSKFMKKANKMLANLNMEKEQIKSIVKN